MKPLTAVATVDESGHPLAHPINSHLENCRACVLLIAFRQIRAFLKKCLHVGATLWESICEGDKKMGAALKDNINANDFVPPPHPYRWNWLCQGSTEMPREMTETVIAQDWVRNLSPLADLWLTNDGRTVGACAVERTTNQGITALGGIPNVQVIAPSRESSSIWPLCNFSCTTLMRNAQPPPTTEHHYDLFRSHPGICDFQSALGRVQLMKYVSLPGPNSSIIQTYCFPLSQLSARPPSGSKARTGGSGLWWAFLMRVPLERQVERPHDLLGVKRQPCGNTSPRLDSCNVSAIFTLAAYFGRSVQAN